MHCLESRRWLLAAPRERTATQHAHLATCAECTRLAHGVANMERSLEAAMLIAVPDALAARMLLARRGRPWLQYAAAALLAVVCVGLALLVTGHVVAPVSPHTVQAVGPTHPAVIAIAEVASEDVAAAARAPAEHAVEMAQSLKRLGLTLRRGDAKAYYVGKCHIAGTTRCDHIVLTGLEGHANIMLVPDYPLADRILVADGPMVALVSPVARGGYIVVADSARTARRMERHIVKG